MWEIDRDYITEKGEINRVGVKGETCNIGFHPLLMAEHITLPGGPIVRFRMKDDDGEVYYGGWLHNDGECLNQQAALAYGMADAGCTTIEVKDKGSKIWRQEIA